MRSLAGAKPRAGTRRCSTAALAWPCGPRPLRCSVLRAVAELAAFAALTTLGQLRRVSSRGALRALPASPALLGAADSRRQAPARVFAIHRHLFAKEAAAQASSLRAGMTRACGARRAAGSMPAARRKPLSKNDAASAMPEACLPARRGGRRSAVVVPAGAGPIRGRLISGEAAPVLKRQRSRRAVRARERGPEHAGTATALPQPYTARQHSARTRSERSSKADRRHCPRQIHFARTPLRSSPRTACSRSGSSADRSTAACRSARAASPSA